MNVPNTRKNLRERLLGIFPCAENVAGIHIDRETPRGNLFHCPERGWRVVDALTDMGFDAKGHAEVESLVRHIRNQVRLAFEVFLVVRLSPRTGVDDWNSQSLRGFEGQEEARLV